jgi:hypothetical protein
MIRSGLGDTGLVVWQQYNYFHFRIPASWSTHTYLRHQIQRRVERQTFRCGRARNCPDRFPLLLRINARWTNERLIDGISVFTVSEIQRSIASVRFQDEQPFRMGEFGRIDKFQIPTLHDSILNVASGITEIFRRANRITFVPSSASPYLIFRYCTERPSGKCRVTKQ